MGSPDTLPWLLMGYSVDDHHVGGEMSHKKGSENVTELSGDKFESITVGRTGEKTTGKIPAPR